MTKTLTTIALTLLSLTPVRADGYGTNHVMRLTRPVVACDSEARLLDYFDRRDHGTGQQWAENQAKNLAEGRPVRCRTYSTKEVMVVTDYAHSHCIKELGQDEYPNEAVCYRIPKGYLSLDTMSVTDGENLLKGETTEAKIYRKQYVNEHKIYDRR